MSMTVEEAKCFASAQLAELFTRTTLKYDWTVEHLLQQPGSLNFPISGDHLKVLVAEAEAAAKLKEANSQ